MMLIARHWNEAAIYRAAYAFEQATKSAVSGAAH
jgi:Asp-tRNA(Asn)/Glu-tRNA(Gln) amidotransferase A subunit family amidase